MTKIKEAVREYNFSDGTLKQNADKVIISVRRDILKFNDRGVDDGVVDAFEDNNEAFDDLPTDEELQGDVSDKASIKDRYREQLLVKIRTVRSMAGEKWGEGTAKYRAYGIEGMDKMTDNDFHRCAKRVVRVATAQLADLASKGLTSTMITDIQTTNTNFDAAIDALEESIQLRDIATQTRVLKGNEVYRELVRLCNIGKDIWASVDEAKYNDYVIYNTPSGEEPAPPITP